MNAWEWTNDAFVATAGVPLEDRGFRFGMAFFESFPVRNGRAEHLAAHLMRLAAGATKVGWKVDREMLGQAGEQVLGCFDPKEAIFARLYLTAGQGLLNAPPEKSRLFLFGEPRETIQPKAHQLVVHPTPFTPLFGGLKTVNYWAHLDAFEQATQAGGTEALLFNPSGELISAAMANVFLQIEGAWLTPPLASGARDGVTRERILRQHPEVREAVIREEDLAKVTSAFLSSSWVGIAPVGSLNFRPLEWNIGDAPTLSS